MRLYSYTNTQTLLTPTTPPYVCTTMAYERAVTPKHMPRIVALQTQHTDTLMPEAEDEMAKAEMPKADG